MMTFEGSGLSNPRQLMADHQGSIVASADASGAAVAINTYDEYGIPGAGNDGTFQYTGQMWLCELGMYYYKARIYSPTLGRFMQTDPIGYEDQFNLYAYVGNDPVNATDPSGECERNAEGVAVGVCPMSDREVQDVQARLGDTHSEIAATDREAVQNNQQIRVQFGSTDVDGKTVLGGTTEQDAAGPITVTIDPTDNPLVEGHDSATGQRISDYPESMEETMEHEIAGEARAIMGGQQDGGAAAVAAENRYRERRGNTFRREGHTGRAGPGPARRWP